MDQINPESRKSKVESRKSKVESREKVETSSTAKHDRMVKQMEYNKTWQKKNNLSRMTLRIPADTRDNLENHAKNRGESLTQFILRSCLAQIERDNLTSSIDLDKLLSD